MRFTIFTPTFNRGYTIEKLYESLKNQTFHDFEWVVVDDGSTDNTESLFESFLNENALSIRYQKVENGGKHRAINLGVQLAKGELFFIVDSDDFLPENALAKIDEVEKTISKEDKPSFAGVCGLKGHFDNSTLGSSFEGTFLDITTLQRTEYGIEGDKAEIFYTEILKKYPFPEFEGENFLTECVVWDKIAFDGLKLRFFNEVVYHCEYLPDGLTSNYRTKYLQNPQGYALYFTQSVRYGKLKGLQKWNIYNQFYQDFRSSFRFCKIAKLLNINVVKLFFGLLGLRVFYKIYDR